MGIFSKLGDLLQGSGISKDLTGALQAEKEEDIQEAIEALSQSGLKRAEGAASDIPAASKQVGVKEAEKTLSDQREAQETPAWAKELSERIEALKSERQGELSRTQAQTVLSRSTLPDHLKEKWLGRIALRGGLPIPEQVEALEREYMEIQKSILSDGVGSPLPLGGSSPQIREEQVENIISNL